MQWEKSQVKHNDVINGKWIIECLNSLNGIDCFFNYSIVTTTSTTALGRMPQASLVVACWISFIYIQPNSDQLLC